MIFADTSYLNKHTPAPTHRQAWQSKAMPSSVGVTIQEGLLLIRLVLVLVLVLVLLLLLLLLVALGSPP